MSLSDQLLWLFILPIPIACIAWTITHEEIFREPREFCIKKSKSCKTVMQRKFFYVFTCEYCFSHYVTIVTLIFTHYQLMFPDWRGYVLGGFGLVWIANVYMSLFQLLRVGMKKEKMEADIAESELHTIKEDDPLTKLQQ